MSKALRFLLVDDDQICLAVTQSILAFLGYDHVAVAADGDEGLSALEESSEAFDVIILDLNMPKLDGLAFLRLAAGLGFQGCIVLLSGEDQKIIRTAEMMGQLLGIRLLGALRKPLDIAKLTEVLVAVSSPNPASSVAASPQSPSLDRLKLIPYYQPQHHAVDGTIAGLEALIRVRTPSGEILGPGKFFSMIPDYEQFRSYTLAMTAKVLDDVENWQREGIACRTSINLDSKVLEDPIVAPAILDMLKARGISSQLICLELTETTLPQDMTCLMEVLARLRMSGFHISLDDYGTGSSNFELLRLCPFTEVKIDGSIIRSAASEPIASNFLSSTASMATQLSIDVIAEGVENASELALCRRVGIEVIQGFLFSIPVSGEDIVPQLRDRPTTAPGGRTAA
ncbi:EAL domain-containing response regulator [Mesorhizobium sp. 10J20-29]